MGPREQKTSWPFGVPRAGVLPSTDADVLSQYQPKAAKSLSSQKTEKGGGNKNA